MRKRHFLIKHNGALVSYFLSFYLMCLLDSRVQDRTVEECWSDRFVAAHLERLIVGNLMTTPDRCFSHIKILLENGFYNQLGRFRISLSDRVRARVRHVPHVGRHRAPCERLRKRVCSQPDHACAHGRGRLSLAGPRMGPRRLPMARRDTLRLHQLGAR